MKTMVKCIICGAIFEAGAKECPVCGADPSQFVPVTPEATQEAVFLRNTEEKFIILGGGTAALHAAEAIRRRNRTCAIVMVTEEAVPPYNRPMLTKAFGAPYVRIAMKDDAWYAEQNILVLTGRRVQGIDPENREVLLSGGIRLQYEKLLYALGARCFIPPIPGTGLSQVVSIRSLEDVNRITGLLALGKRRAVVIGGGVLGLEAAWALKQKGCEVTVLERSDRLMSRQLSREASEMLQGICAREGVTIRTGANTAGISGSGHVEAVKLEGGDTLPADLVVISSGVRANSEIAKAAGAQVGRAVTVNGHMETNLPHVYACGDCAEVLGMNATIWPVATEMGRIAGANAAGEPLAFTPVSLAITFQGMNTALYADGDTGRDPNAIYHTDTVRDDAKQTLEIRYEKDGKLCGVILLGDIGKARKYAGVL